VKALLVVRPDAAARPGGDIVHAQRAANALRGLGIDVHLFATDTPDPTGYDVAHVFGIAQPEIAQQQLAALRRHEIPIALSPMWFDQRSYLATAPRIERALSSRSADSIERRLADTRRKAQQRSWSGPVARNADRRIAALRELLLQADVALPASEVEAYLYGERLQITTVPFVVAPLGVDDDAFNVKRPAVRSGVLCTGRVESQKNQAALLYALRDVDVAVTILGDAGDAQYVALCRRWATARTQFIDRVPREGMLEAMARAHVHARPAWLDGPGLTSLDAAATGAHIVVGDRGCEREYFGPDVEYTNPADPATIRTAVLRALKRVPRERGDSLERRLGAYTWQFHAEATLEGYVRAISARRR
jgi:glycosyltransferase involved in cell wall biosynthesis